jgi:hypothetical protein
VIKLRGLKLWIALEILWVPLKDDRAHHEVSTFTRKIYIHRTRQRTRHADNDACTILSCSGTAIPPSFLGLPSCFLLVGILTRIFWQTDWPWVNHCIILRFHLCISSMAPQPFDVSWPFFQFCNPTQRRAGQPRGVSSSTGRVKNCLLFMLSRPALRPTQPPI